MPLWDLDLETLVSYAADVAEPADFDEFWVGTLAQARTHDLALRLQPVDTGLALVDVFDVTFAGFDGQPVRGWLTRHRDVPGPLPGVLTCNGYGGGRGLATGHLGWAVAGYAELFLDTRGAGQPLGRRRGHPRPGRLGSRGAGLHNPRHHGPVRALYRRLYTDAVRGLEALRAVDGVDRPA
jgi:cephalosporin-C deacetylase